MKRDDCIFCKIANGEIPSDTVYEDEHFRAILDLSPAAEGHTLIFKTAVRLASAVKKAMNCDGINIVQNNGEAAGQTVHHLHVHIIPRYASEKDRIVTWVQHESEPSRQKEIAARIAAGLD